MTFTVAFWAYRQVSVCLAGALLSRYTPARLKSILLLSRGAIRFVQSLVDGESHFEHGRLETHVVVAEVVDDLGEV
jgi:hypothetical protein